MSENKQDETSNPTTTVAGWREDMVQRCSGEAGQRFLDKVCELFDEMEHDASDDWETSHAAEYVANVGGVIDDALAELTTVLHVYMRAPKPIRQVVDVVWRQPEGVDHFIEVDDLVNSEASARVRDEAKALSVAMNKLRRRMYCEVAYLIYCRQFIEQWEAFIDEECVTDSKVLADATLAFCRETERAYRTTQISVLEYMWTLT